MTKDELDALPEIGGISMREEIRDGRKVIIPVLAGRAMFQGPEDGSVIDVHGARWMIGVVDGVRCKQRAS